MPHGVSGAELFLKVHQPFVARLEAAVDPRNIRPWKPYLISIDHKLNVARYNAGLIIALKPADYSAHLNFIPPPGGVTVIEYANRCAYYASNWDQYALGMLFFIESFAAAAFSLFDSSGHLLQLAYNLTLPRKEPKKSGSGHTDLKVSFVNAANDIKNEKGATNMYGFLEKYLRDSANCYDWMRLLKLVRNHSTHSRVTDLVQLVSPTPPEEQRIDLRSRTFGDPNDHDLKEFVEKAFLGLEEFTELLYEKLTVQVEADKAVPITGHSDSLV